jgi:putative transposase
MGRIPQATRGIHPCGSVTSSRRRSYPRRDFVTSSFLSFFTLNRVKDQNVKCKIVMHDNDGKYSKPFLSKLKSLKMKPHRTAIRSPNTVAFVERFIQSIGQECLDHFVVFGHKHMDVLCSQYRDHYHGERPHQGLDNQLIERGLRPKKRMTSAKSRTVPITIRFVDIRCHERLGGLLKSYSRKAA